MAIKRKLIEVALPLEDINRESAREKSIRHGHPSTLHLWWARRPLAACRTVLFASIVDDPSSHPDKFPSEEDQVKERERLFNIIRELVKWENTNNEQVLKQAREEILKATDGNPPPVLDPFCGGGSIPLEAQRLGLEAHASDLNPVAVLITKALIEIPPKFAGQPPVRPEGNGQTSAVQPWKGAQGLAEDVRYYGQWMRDEAEKRIGHLYPKVKITSEMVADRPDLKQYLDHNLTVIAWLWARTVTCPNPACKAQMPLVRSFALSTKSGKQAWVEPIVEDSPFADPQKALAGMGEAQEVLSQNQPQVRFKVRTGQGQAPEGTVNRQGTRCICCNTPVPFDHVRSEGRAGRMDARLMTIVTEGSRGRVYLPPLEQHITIANQAKPTWRPEAKLPHNPRDFKTPNYGMTTFADLFTPRQLVALTTFSDLVGEAREKVLADAKAAGLGDDGMGIDGGGTGAQAYADAVATYLAFALDKAADYSSTICSWNVGRDGVRDTFARQALPMTWDYAESNCLGESSGSYISAISGVKSVIESAPASRPGYVSQLDATTSINNVEGALVLTDPPYYDNIGYADLSDYFYIWLRRSLSFIYPSLFSTLLTPKKQELVATPYRFNGSQEVAKKFFEEGLGDSFSNIHKAANPRYPFTVYYAFKQAETESDDEGNGRIASTGWETMLEGLLRAGFVITGTWPMRTERGGRTLSIGTSALASSVVLACRPRSKDAGMTTRRDFLRALKEELPQALKTLQQGNIAPVDLAQAAIGPGMAVFSRYSKVVEPDGRPMRVRTALQLINQVLDEVLTEQESEYDPDTRWALAWYEQHGLETGPFGDAETLSKAKDTAVGGLVEAGILETRGGKVRLLRRGELDSAWDPTTDKRMPVWEVTQHLCHALVTGGEAAAAEIAGKVGALGEVARDLAYRLYTMCERKGWAQEALAYNSLVIAWPEIQRRVQAGAGGKQTELGL